MCQYRRHISYHSIHTPKAEPFKQWLAKVGYERIQEIENPELAAERARQTYRDLGYTEDWIAKGMQSAEIRGKLTDEWKARDVKKGKEYAILTAECDAVSPVWTRRVRGYRLKKWLVAFCE